jgi:NADH:ubiquinone oxidoreductase subunit F (NADH-binding)
MKKSGLRGRGGAGFPTWMKWDFTRKAKGNPKYMICNADGGRSGALHGQEWPLRVIRTASIEGR